MKKCTALRHLPYEDLGYFDDLLRKAGFDVRYVDAPAADPLLIESLDADLLVVLGGPPSANDEQDYPFIASELKLLERRLQQNLPTMGICLGAQLMARALQAEVLVAPRAEIGWMPLTLSRHGRDSTLRHLDGVPVFHWHGEVFSLPDGAVSLASTPGCPHQAFALGPNILGLQFHPEVTAKGLETWYVGHYRALQDPARPSANALRADAARHADAMSGRGANVLQEWLDGLVFT